MTLEFAFGDPGRADNGILGTGLPLLRGAPRETIAESMEPAGTHGGFRLWRSEECIVGFACSGAGAGLENAARVLYADLMSCVGKAKLCRIWNIVPHINRVAPGGLENYQAFCKGRSLAFESAFGRGYTQRLPAASAIGTRADSLTVAFLAGIWPTRHFENPSQVPAYEYPSEHGPRPPSFARATLASTPEELKTFISGTSAVVGHETFAPHDTARQLDCTFENLRLISRAAGLGDKMGDGSGVQRHFKVYLRHAAELETVAHRVERGLLQPGDRVTYLEADICREALNVEIEAMVRAPAGRLSVGAARS